MNSAMYTALSTRGGGQFLDEIEEWRTVLDGLYEVSSHGRIRHLRTSREIKPIWMRGLRYWAVAVMRKNKKPTYIGYGKLIAETFLGAKPPKARLRYRDGDTRNCQVQNLYYATKEEMGGPPSEVISKRLKMTAKDVEDIATFYNQFPEATIDDCMTFFTLGNGKVLYSADQIRFARLESGIAQLSLFGDDNNERENERKD